MVEVVQRDGGSYHVVGWITCSKREDGRILSCLKIKYSRIDE